MKSGFDRKISRAAAIAIEGGGGLSILSPAIKAI